MTNTQKTPATFARKPSFLPLEAWLEQCGDQLQEVAEQRSEMGKLFRLGENRFRAVLYANPIHYRDRRSGALRNINNRFVRTEDGLRNDANGNLSVVLRRNSVEVADPQDYRIGWSIENGRAVWPRIADTAPARKSVFERLLGPDTVLQSEAVYEDILHGADWRCQINGNAFKDEVVFHRAEQAAPSPSVSMRRGCYWFRASRASSCSRMRSTIPCFCSPSRGR